MARFVIEGTTLVGWTQLVRADTEDEATRAARLGIDSIGVLGHEVLLDDVRHRITRCRRVVSTLPVPARRGSNH